MINPVIISIHALREEGDGGFRRVFRHRRTHFNPRPPRGGRHIALLIVRSVHLFQSTPSARRATREPRIISSAVLFQSTPSARRATRIFAPVCSRQWYFNPRPPRGGRPGLYGSLNHNRHFNPRPPRGGRPNSGNSRGQKLTISIHALREEGDCGFVWLPQSQ